MRRIRHRILRWFLLLPLACGAPLLNTPPLQAATPASIQLRVEVNPKEITIGDPIHYSMTVVYSNEVAPSPLSVPNPMGDFELLDYAPSQPKKLPNEKLTLTHHLILTSFSTGTHTLPSLSLLFSTTDGKQAEAKTETIDITVKSVLEMWGDRGNLQPLKGFFNFRSYVWVWIALALLLLAGGGFAFFYFKKKREGLFPEGPPKQPEERAWETLQALEDSDLLSTGQIKEWYFRLSLILRRYLEDRFQFSALDRTTTELLLEFRRLNFSLDLSTDLRTFFDNSDLVKFAKWTPTEEEIENDLVQVKKIISVTTPETKETPKEPAPL